LVIDLRELSKNITDYTINNPLVIHKFYQGTVKILGDITKPIQYSIKNFINFTDNAYSVYLNILDRKHEKIKYLACSFLLISEVDNCIISNLYLKFTGRCVYINS
jgi:hypothetical protein